MKQFYYYGWYIDADGIEQTFKAPKKRSLFPLDEIKQHLPRYSEVVEFFVVDEDENRVDY